MDKNIIKAFILNYLKEDDEFVEELKSLLLNNMSYNIRLNEENLIRLAAFDCKGNRSKLMRKIGYAQTSTNAVINKLDKYGIDLNDYKIK